MLRLCPRALCLSLSVPVQLWWWLITRSNQFTAHSVLYFWCFCQDSKVENTAWVTRLVSKWCYEAFICIHLYSTCFISLHNVNVCSLLFFPIWLQTKLHFFLSLDVLHSGREETAFDHLCSLSVSFGSTLSGNTNASFTASQEKVRPATQGPAVLVS